jgi:hypothetical protein
MKTTLDQIRIVSVSAHECIEELLGKQDSFKRFLYCSFDKIYMCFESLEILYEQIDLKPNVEYSIGIILRSVMMNCIMIQNMKYISLGMKTDQSNYIEVKDLLDRTSLKFIADGTENIIKDLEFFENLTDQERTLIANNLANQFPDVFSIRNGVLPKLKNEYRVNLRQIFKSTRHPNLVWGNSVYNHYAFYSKYDHLSHWSPEFSTILNFDTRKKQVDSSVAIIFTHVMDLLFLGMAYIPELYERWYTRYKELEKFGEQMIVNDLPYFNES